MVDRCVLAQPAVPSRHLRTHSLWPSGLEVFAHSNWAAAARECARMLNSNLMSTGQVAGVAQMRRNRDRRSRQTQASAAASARHTTVGRVAVSTGSSPGFSAFLLDELPSVPAEPRAAPTALPALSATKNGSASAGANGNAQAPPAGPRMYRHTSAGVVPTTLEDDIPVLEANRFGAFHSDGDDDDDDDEEEEGDSVGMMAAVIDNHFELHEEDKTHHHDGDDEDEDDEEEEDDDILVDGAIFVEDDNDDDVPVLQTVEDAHAFDVVMGQKNMAASKKFSWRETARRTTKRRHTSNHRGSPGMSADQALRPSYRPTDIMSSSSGSLISRNESAVNVDRHLVRSGWLYKQSEVLKSWKRRFFVLIKRTNTTTGEFSASLQYYKGSNFGKLRSELNFQDGPLVVRFVEFPETKRQFCFEVTQGALSFICQASDDDDASAWVCHLQSLSSSGDDMAASTASLVNSGVNGVQVGRPVVGGTGTMDDRGIRIVAELRRLLHNSKSPEASKCASFIKSFDNRSLNALRQFREFHAAVTMGIMKAHSSRILNLLEETTAKNASKLNGAPLAPISTEALCAMVSRHVEEVLFVPLKDSIRVLLRRAYHEEESVINRKVRWLQGKDQTYFNIPLDQISWKEWRKPSAMLAHIVTATTPSTKYDILMHTIAEIQSTFAEEHNKLVDDEPLETDDIIPIFTFVVSNSGIENLISLKALLTELNGSWAVGGSLDDGAALSIFNHAVDFISNVSIPAVLEDIFKDQITLAIDGDWRRVFEFEVEPTYRYGAIVHNISPHGYSAVGANIAQGFVLVTINGQNVVLWPYQDILTLLKESTSPHRLAFIPDSSYFKILTTNKSLWNVALMHACQRGDVFSVQMLLANGADVNYFAHECGGNTPLHVAVSCLHFNVVSYMLQHGAKVKTLGEYGRCALHMIGSPCTLPSSASNSSAVPAIAGNSLRKVSNSSLESADKVVLIIKKLLAHGSEVEIVDIYGNTPLMLLAEKGCLSGIDALIEATDGAIDINMRNWQRGKCALTFAAKEGHFSVVEALLDYGASPDIRTLRGETALHFAATIAATDMCKLLVERGADVNARTNEGMTPLMVAVSKGYGVNMSSKLGSKQKQNLRSSTHVDNSSVMETVDFLLVSDADKEAVCDLYRMALHYAALYGDREVFNHLQKRMSNDSDSQMLDIYGQSALSIADGKRLPSETESAARSDHEGDDNAGDDEGDDHDDDHDDDEDDEDRASYIQMVLSSSRDLNLKSLAQNDLVTEDHDGVLDIVAGSFNAIANLLLRFENYRLEEVDALIWYCDYGSSYREMVDFLRDMLKRSAGTANALYVRRMVLHALDKLVENMKHRVECDLDICNYISELCGEVFPFAIDDDPQCAQWLSASLLPLFVEACRSKRLPEFQVLSLCEQDYTSLKHFLCSAKQHDPTLKFLDDALFQATAGIEIISESMRRRLSIAGVWTGSSKKSFVVKNDGTLSSSLENSSSTTITPWMPHGNRLTTPLDRTTSRSWILDVDTSVIAQQITVFQHYLFSKIKVSEILAPKRSAEKTPAYDRLRLLHNHISMWVVSQIVEQDDVDQRAEILSYFIKVAGVLLKPLQNLDGFMAVMNATNDSSIFRLKKTWGRLPPQARDLWHALKKYTEKGARPLNKLTKEANPPLIPYLGVVIQNVLALQEFPDRVEGDLINFKKIRFIGTLIRRILALQRTPYLLPTEKRILEHLCSSLQYSDADACFKRSLQVEPRVEAPASGS